MQVTPDQIADRVLVVGDPKRAESAAGLLEEVQKVGSNREYVTFTGKREGRRITVSSHGIGSAGAGICFEELGALFVIASLHDIRAGGILTVDGNPTRAAQDMSQYNPFRSVVEEGVSAMLEIAIDALTRVEEPA
ncbi:MAG: hypothetical protein V3V82_03885 [Acidimicrobiia bacterium]